MRFALRPDARWGTTTAPAVGTRFTYDIDLRTKSGSTTCPVRFSVTKSSGQGWAGLSESNQVLVLVIVAILAIGIIALANGGGSHDDDLDHYPMGQ